MRRLLLVGYMGLASTLACDKKDEAKSAPPPVVGADRSGVLQQGDFRFRCVGPNDAYCGDPALFGTGMPRFGIGASAQFQFVPKGSQDAIPVRDVVSRTRLRVDDQGLVTPLAEGKAGILANTGKDGALSDVFNIDVGAKAKFRFEALKGELGFHVWPEDKDGEPLAGGYACEWSLDDPSIATITPSPNATRIVLKPGRNGRTTLRLKYAGEFNQEIPVEINL